MIPVSVSTAVFLYLIFTLFTIFIFWIWFEKGKAFQKYELQPKEVWVCNICTYTYVDSQSEGLSRCPQCKSWNEKEEEAK